MKMLLVVAAMAACAGTALAAESYTSSGAFRSKSINMPIQTAIAFRGKSLLDKSDVIVVAVTNAKMHADAMAQYYDRRRAVDRRINDSDTPGRLLRVQAGRQLPGLLVLLRLGQRVRVLRREHGDRLDDQARERPARRFAQGHRHRSATST
jgi:hypothetical protein